MKTKTISEKTNKQYGYILRKEELEKIPFEVMTDADTAIDNLENKDNDCNKVIKSLEDFGKSDKPLIVEYAYTSQGNYVGEEYMAIFLYKKGIAPELINESYEVCSIGFSKKDNKWYGWSHRAIRGFKIGSKVKKGDIAYKPYSEDDFIDETTDFWKAPHHFNVTSEIKQKDGMKQVYTSWTLDNTTPNLKLRGTTGFVYTPLPTVYGRGECMANTLDDARQMAIDFAMGVR